MKIHSQLKLTLPFYWSDDVLGSPIKEIREWSIHFIIHVLWNWFDEVRLFSHILVEVFREQHLK